MYRTLVRRPARRNSHCPATGTPPFPNTDSELVRRVIVSHPGGETAGLALPFETHPRDHRPLEGVERLTLEDYASSGQHHHNRFVVHRSTLAGAT
jgi:hypothetical protein